MKQFTIKGFSTAFQIFAVTLLFGSSLFLPARSIKNNVSDKAVVVSAPVSPSHKGKYDYWDDSVTGINNVSLSNNMEKYQVSSYTK